MYQSWKYSQEWHYFENVTSLIISLENPEGDTINMAKKAKKDRKYCLEYVTTTNGSRQWKAGEQQAEVRSFGRKGAGEIKGK